MQRRWWLTTVTTVPVTVLALAGVAPQAGAASAPGARHGSSTSGAPVTQASRLTTGSHAGDPFCSRLGKQYQASSAAQSFCFGPQFHKGSQALPAVAEGSSGVPNVDAARMSEDVSSAGVSAQGQSEVSIAAAGPYVVEAWNDSTGFITACPAPMSKEEITGLGFSANGGKSFSDLGGLPNANCKKLTYFGDPSVAAYRVGGQTFFYISSLYLSNNGLGPTHGGFPLPAWRDPLKGEESLMGETRRKFDRDFREGAVRLVRETGKPIAQVARDLGVNEGTLGNWVHADRRRRDGSGGALSEDERAELARLRRENAELAMRCDVLKRSVALWVQDAMGSR